MRWLVLVGSMTAAVACTSLNPAYESEGSSDGEMSGQQGTTGIAETTGGEATRAETTSPPPPDDTTESGGSSSGEPHVEPYCRFDLYAINEVGELYVLDPDEGDAELVLSDPKIASWAIATDPDTGLLYVSERFSPTTVWRVDPFTATIDPDPLGVEVELDDPVARATIDGGTLWLGTELTQRFVWLPLEGGPILDDQTVEGRMPRGGDMLFLESSECAIVPTLMGQMYEVCFSTSPPSLFPLEVVGLPVDPLLNGLAVDETGRLWLSTGDPYPRLVELVSGEPWMAMPPLDYRGLTMNDLATLVHPPGAC